MTRDDLLRLINDAVKEYESFRRNSLMSDLEDDTTEYILTAQLIMKALGSGYKAISEPMCRKIVNLVTSSATKDKRESFGKQRHDVLLGEYIKPLAIFEIKMGVRSYLKIDDDVAKIIDVLSLIKVGKDVFGVLLFEIPVHGKISASDASNDAIICFNKILNEIKISFDLNFYDIVDYCVMEIKESAEIDENSSISREGFGSFIYTVIIQRR